MTAANPATGLTKEELAALIDYFGADYLQKLADIANNPPTQADPNSLSPMGHKFQPLPIDFVSWAERNFYVRDRIDPVTYEATQAIGPITFLDWQKCIFGYMLDPRRPFDEWFQLMVISSLKKTGKTEISAAIGRYTAEVFGNYSEVVCSGADKDQAKDRIYEAIMKSIELGPAYNGRIQTSYATTPPPDWPDAPTELWVPDWASPQWVIRGDGARFIPNRGRIYPIPKDYKGQAGGHQTATLFTEMWAMDDLRARRLFDEMTPPPILPRAYRLCEGYASWEGESGLWEEIWEWAMDPDKGARMVTRAELQSYGGGWPFPPDPNVTKYNQYSAWRNHPDPIPLFVNSEYRLCAYIDQGESARRMPWLTPAYYDGQKSDTSYNRHHLNVAEAHNQEFIPTVWRQACHIENAPPLAQVRAEAATLRTHREREQLIASLPPNLKPFFAFEPPPAGSRDLPKLVVCIPDITADDTIVLGCDASVSEDTTALVAVSLAPWNDEIVLLRDYTLWEPTKHNPMNYDRDVKPLIVHYEELCNVLEFTYDAMQLHDLATRLRVDEGYWVKSFSQQTGRDQSDRDLFNRIRDRKIFWDPNHPLHPKLEEHFKGAARRVPKDAASSNSEKMRIVKKGARNHIDLIVTLSMAVAEIARLSV